MQLYYYGHGLQKINIRLVYEILYERGVNSMIRDDKHRISISLDSETISILEYNAEAMGITKSQLITRYLHMIGKAGEKKEILFIKHFSKE